jgi:hypothetical protein
MARKWVKKCFLSLRQTALLSAEGKKTVKEKMDHVMVSNRCFNCLRKNHRSADCRSPVRCGVETEERNITLPYMTLGRKKPKQWQSLQEQN